MKIDLHCHTKKIKDGDPLEREISAENFNQKIIDNDIKYTLLMSGVKEFIPIFVFL